MKLCGNCLDDVAGARPYPVGHDKGTQRDPYTTLLDLCEPCIELLDAGDLPGFHARYLTGREVTR